MKNMSGGVAQKDLIVRMLSALFPDVKIYLFGSRATGKYNERSDIDLALDLGRKMDLSEIAKAKNVMEAINILRKVELVLLPASKSITYKLPELSVATPPGLYKAAAVPTPLVSVAAPLPAIVVTTAAGVINLILLLRSAITKFPDASRQILAGSVKVAAVPVPSVEPCVALPAKVVTVFVLITIFRIWLLR